MNAQKPDATAPPFATQLRRRLKLENRVYYSTGSFYRIIIIYNPSPVRHNFLYWNVTTGLPICMHVLWPCRLMKIERILSFCGLDQMSHAELHAIFTRARLSAPRPGRNNQL